MALFDSRLDSLSLPILKQPADDLDAGVLSATLAPYFEFIAVFTAGDEQDVQSNKKSVKLYRETSMQNVHPFWERLELLNSDKFRLFS